MDGSRRAGFLSLHEYHALFLAGNKQIRMTFGFVETLSFQQIVKHLFTEGTVPAPRTAPAFCDCVVLPSLGLSLQWGCHSGGGEALHAVAPKER